MLFVKLMNDIIKNQLGFQVFVILTCGIKHANAGLDVAMPVALLWKADEISLVQILKNDSVNASRLDDIATPLVATWAKFGTLDPEAEARGMPLDPNQRRA
ncbi:uncharacterized protein FPRO_10293 [Fusarium proliferatum ET1]|uniref:Uncharacterized protein n=1 Tax=Fusarium proliferatum (strain ET1) TaxID=1227346 RepID=A0A1L7VM61_FUSPR|nr:uncharacterized protein FPRO_10293 [Fusarium proliferatum ET1]CZR40705.1 uncharacterized protein FPRO_10293 [Fusarium proliferatum ET1]